VRQFSPVETIGGGVVLDIRPGRRKGKDQTVVPFLETLENRNAEAILGALLERSAQGLTTDETVKRTGWPPSQVQEVAAKLVTAKHARQVANQPPTFANAQSVNECAATLIRTVEDFHRANPLLSGTTKQDLLGKTRDSGVAVFETALDDLVKARKVTVTGDVVQSAGRELTLTSDRAGIRECRAGGAGLRDDTGKTSGGFEAGGKVAANPVAGKGAGQSGVRLDIPWIGAEPTERNAGKLQEAARRPTANQYIQGTYRGFAEIRHTAAGAPGPGTGDAAGGRPACYNVRSTSF
jgi:hypothetical protein